MHLNEPVYKNLHGCAISLIPAAAPSWIKEHASPFRHLPVVEKNLQMTFCFTERPVDASADPYFSLNHSTFFRLPVGAAVVSGVIRCTLSTPDI